MKISTLVSLALLLTACGGGSGDGSDDSTDTGGTDDSTGDTGAACSGAVFDGGIGSVDSGSDPQALAQLQGVSVITGSLLIAGVNDLAPLACLESIEGNLTIVESTLADLDGLSGLTSIGGYLRIRDTPNLANLDGLSNLSTLQDLELVTNGSLTDIDGLAGLQAMDGFVTIEGHPVLATLDGLSGLASVAGDVMITDNLALANLGGLSALSSVGGNLAIKGNAGLPNVDGLSSLASIGGFLEISDNGSLTSISGLAGLTSADSLQIVDNVVLTSLFGLNNLTDNGGGVGIRGNDLLTDLEGLANFVSLPGGVSISGAALSNVDVFSDLTSIGGFLSVVGTDLADLTAFSSLTAADGFVEVSANPSLVNVDGLGDIALVSSPFSPTIIVNTNESLCQADVDRLVERLLMLADASATVGDTGSNDGECVGVCGMDVPDGGFEGGTPSVVWTEASDTFGTLICDLASCTATGGPRSGDWWSYLGGPVGGVENGSVEQGLTIESGATTLRFYLQIADATAVNPEMDVLTVSIDGDTVFSATAEDVVTYARYTAVEIDVTAYADDASHTLRFEGVTQGVQRTSFYLDDVALVCG